MKKFAAIIILSAIIFSACQQHRALSDAIAAADAVVCTNPDSALSILSRADTTGAPARLRAHYVLLTEKASDKADIVHTSDSLISATARYYQGRNDSLEAQALYYKGVVQFNNQDFGRALISLMQAHEVADRADDRFYKAMSSRTLADVYDELLSFDAAARCDSMALAEFYDASRPDYAMYERYYLPYYYAQAGRFNEADSLLDLNSTDSFFFETPIRKAWYYQTRALCHFNRGAAKTAAAWYDSCLLNVPYEISSKNYSRAVINSLFLRDIEKSKTFLEYADALVSDSSDSLYLKLAQAKLYALEGEYKQAFVLQDKIYSAYNKDRNVLLSHPYTTVLTDYFKTLSAERQQSLEATRIKMYLFISMAMLALVFAWGLYLFYQRKKRIKEILIDNLIFDIERLKDELHRRDLQAQSEQVVADTSDVNSSFNNDSSYIRLVDRLFSIEKDAPESAAGDAALRKTFRSTLKSLNSLEFTNNIEMLADSYSNNLVARIRKEVPSLSEKQIKYISLLILGFSKSSICYVLNTNTNAIYQLRSRIKSNIESSQSDCKELYLSALKINKT